VFCSIQQQKMHCIKSRGNVLLASQHLLTSLARAAPAPPQRPLQKQEALDEGRYEYS
jgi:hypothetical protein